jgi:perosamine synthetase
VRFVDIEETTLGLDPSQVRAAVNENTAAIIAVDVFGNPCRLIDLEEIARLRDLVLIEDSCEALGSLLDGRALGSFGNASVFAFYPNKQITTGEGGMVVTDDAELAGNLRSMRNQGRDEDGTWLRHVQLGYNYRIDELSAALGVAQLRRREEMRRARAQVAAAYDRLLAQYKWVKRPAPAVGATVDWFVYVLQLGPEVDRDRLVTQLEHREIPTRPYFSPIHLQPFYRREFGFSPGDYPVTERVAASTLAVPFSSRMTNEMVDHVVDAIASCVAEQGAA